MAVGEVITYTAQQLMTDGERIVIEIAQQATKISIPEEQMNEDYLVKFVTSKRSWYKDW